MLNVGCGNIGSGDVNVDVFRGGFNIQIGKGEFVNPSLIRNFILADACHLPFKSKVFTVAFSSHVVEHVKFPELMLSEMCRVTCERVVVRCPHRCGSGAKRPFHLYYFDESFFHILAIKLGYRSVEHITVHDWAVTSHVPFPDRLKGSLVWRFLKHVERRVLKPSWGIPYELESCIYLRKKL